MAEHYDRDLGHSELARRGQASVAGDDYTVNPN